MSTKACHSEQTISLVDQDGISYWRASNYQLEESPTGDQIKAARAATWERSTPFAFYRPLNKRRERDLPHLQFASLVNHPSGSFRFAVQMLAERYGLLGLLHNRYRGPVLPPHKSLIAPEAVITEDGTLKEVDPETEGIEALQSAIGWKLNENVVALPSELEFFRKSRSIHEPLEEDSSGEEVYPEPIPWEEVREPYGAVMLLDGRVAKKASVVCTREPANSWRFALPDLTWGGLSKKDVLFYLNKELTGVSPYGTIGEDGELRIDWLCPTLLQAVRLMFLLDLGNGATIKRCRSRGCPSLYRMGSQKSDYCSEECASRASTRMNRGQVP